ncbi:MAG: inositol-3-phosphate synthase [Planctomycetota bacterium]
MSARRGGSKTEKGAESPARGRLGVWVVGLGGGLATTMVCGARMIARGLASNNGLVTSTPAFSHLEVADLGDLVFGGHDIRPVSLHASALEIHRDTGTIPFEPLEAIRADLDAVDENLRLGTVVNCGAAVTALAGKAAKRRRESLADTLDGITRDLEEFRDLHGLRDVVVVNLASTEPRLEPQKDHQSIAGFRRLVAEDRRTAVRASSLYAWAAISLGFPFLNFTPSNAALLPAHLKLAAKKGVPVMGNDGKTGETLVKSALAPMFKYRHLEVMSWQGYNILGDRDGQVLADERNKASKVETKDGVLNRILGYPLHTHVAIDYVPSLSDLKTAWDFIHFRGFLDYKMSLQFTWQGCDAILAAPIVLDMVRLADYAHRSGEEGLMTQLACFFKRPLGVDEHDLHFQFHHLMDYLAARRGAN